jgi:phosphate starvation-inducible PhoH-like protein
VPDQTVIVPVPDNALLPALLGPADQLLRLMEAAFPDTDFLVRGNEFTITGPDASRAAQLVEEQVRLLLGGHVPTPASVAQAIEMVKAGERPSEVLSQEVLRSSRGRSVRPKTSGQKRYVDAIHANTITFGIGPAGTGKSYLAVAVAVEHLQAKKVERIILTRPAVEAGERLGFLPGDLLAKVDPYLRPLYDALYDMLTAQGTLELMQKGIIEIAPLAYMRGRTLNSAFIILDEAQNATREQMKMFLTRIGFGSKAVVTGDASQVDLDIGKSGLHGLENILEDIPDLAFMRLTSKDVVRHKIVQDIVDAYDRFDERKVR